MAHRQPSQNNDRRVFFTRNAKLSLARFDKQTGEPTAQISTLSGYVMTWNDLSDDRGGYKVRLLPDSAHFDPLTIATFNHDPANLIGSTQNQTLRITLDDVGAKVEIDLPDTCTGRDVEELVEGKYVQGMSFTISQPPTFKITTENGVKIVNISSFTADEVTVTAIPSFSQTSIGILNDEEPEPEPEAASPAPIAPAARIAQSLTLQKLKLDAMTPVEK